MAEAPGFPFFLENFPQMFEREECNPYFLRPSLVRAPLSRLGELLISLRGSSYDFSCVVETGLPPLRRLSRLAAPCLNFLFPFVSFRKTFPKS